ncbi:MAG: hypothetical protein ACYSWP_13785, partial [Planctomycetota bacterium]
MAKKKTAGQMNFSFDGSSGKKTKVKAKPSKKAKVKAKKKVKAAKGKAKKVSKRAGKTKKTADTTSFRKRRKAVAATAESMAASQRAISISEFFAKNRHLLGFDNPRKALLTATKEAVDNSLDACEEAHILPDLWVSIKP